MTSKIASVANLAYQVFTKHAATAVSSENALVDSTSNIDSLEQPVLLPKDTLGRLVEVFASVTPGDVDFDARLLTDSSGFHHAPVVYVHIVENEVFSMGIFVLRQGARIPLHDHPGMHGLCKVLLGNLRVRAYHAVKRAPAPDLASRLRRWQRASLSELVCVRLAGDNLLTPDSRPTLLTPFDGNFHEIQALEGGAAFLDILAPPYDHDLGTRVCRYYREVTLPPVVQPTQQQSHSVAAAPDGDVNDQMHHNSDQQLYDTDQFDQNISTSVEETDEADSDTLLYLLETPQPADFVCNSAEYTGPKVT